MQTIQIKKIAQKWRDALKNDPAILNFCLEKYGKQPTIFVGINGKSLPTKKYCPLIIILPGVKTEGLELSQYSYGITVSWAIEQPNVLVDGVEQKWSENIIGEIIEFLGVYETDDLGQLIYETLAEASPNNPVTKIDYDIETQEHYPQFPGFMILTTEIDVPLGGEIVY